MDEQLKQHVASRGYIKGAITRLHNYVTNTQLDSISKELLNAKRDRLISAFGEYETICKKILFLDPNDSEDIEQFENKYFDVLASLEKAISCKLSNNSCDNHSSMSISKIKLPAISIKTFDGKFTEYIPFKNMFQSMIHDDRNLDNIQKLYYLRSFLKDEPFDLIKNLPIAAESYDDALKLLNERYDNIYKIVSEHICSILDLKNIVKLTASNLREFVSFVKQQLSAIKQHEPNIKYWDAILMCILFRKLDTNTARAYQLERPLHEQPKLEDFLKFLERRALAMEDTEQGSQSSSSSKVVAHVAGEHVTGEVTCSYCKFKGHKLYICKRFLIARK